MYKTGQAVTSSCGKQTDLEVTFHWELGCFRKKYCVGKMSFKALHRLDVYKQLL